MKIKLVTIGVYGFAEEDFFQALVDRKVDTFCDVRARRGMRGATYSFANSTRLQQRLQEFGIQYVHLLEFAPNPEVRALQQEEDRRLKIAKRARTRLSPKFVDAYERECLASYAPQDVLSRLEDDANIICFCCVESYPTACHRSLLTAWLESEPDIEVEHILPD